MPIRSSTPTTLTPAEYELGYRNIHVGNLDEVREYAQR